MAASNHAQAHDPAVAASMRYCQQVARTQARNFYYGMKLTPEPRRSALYAVYAFMRACDDLVDAPADGAQPSPAVGHARVASFRQQMQRVLDGGPLPDAPAGASVWPAFRHVATHYPINPADLHAMLDGQAADLETHDYATFEDLYNYCYNVASTVGLVCIAVWGCDDAPATRKMAEERGIALQLTNILRDLREDARRGRVYLPKEDFERFDYDPAHLAAGEADAGFEEFMRHQVKRALSYYDRSADLETHLSPDCRAACRAITRVYRGLLDKIAAHPRRVLERRVRLSGLHKTAIALRALSGW